MTTVEGWDLDMTAKEALEVLVRHTADSLTSELVCALDTLKHAIEQLPCRGDPTCPHDNAMNRITPVCLDCGFEGKTNG